MCKTREQKKIIKLAKQLIKELDKAGFKYQDDTLTYGHIDIWTNIYNDMGVTVESITNHWQIKEGKN